MKELKQIIGLFLPVYYSKITNIETGEEVWRYHGEMDILHIPIGSFIVVICFLCNVFFYLITR